MKKVKIKNERIFVWFYEKQYRKIVEPSDLGRYQFFENQSFGSYSIHDDGLDNYFYVLYYGKRCFDLLTREYQQLYINGEWWGLYQIWIDWKGDRWMLPKLLKWHPSLPEWITKEELIEIHV